MIEKLNQYIDHTLLKAEASLLDIDRLCEEAIEYQFQSVCVNPSFVQHCSSRLNSHPIDVCTVVGFPLGANTLETKKFETQKALEEGATEIDMVIHIPYLKQNHLDKLTNEIETLKKVCSHHILKVIIETALLTEEEIMKATQCTLEAGADFIKTSTGFSTRGANLNDIQLMKKASHSQLKIKASGGIKNLSMAKAMIEAGASRLGTSSGVSILQEWKSTF